jgi:Ser/Thr protein kinase RdoA (MazF antagonist)
MLGPETTNLSELLQPWGDSCRPEGPPELPPEPGFSQANVVRIQTARGPLALRGWPNPGLSRQRIEGLHRLLQHVADCVPVAVPLTTRTGSSLIEYNGQLWQLEPWMPGVADYRDDPTPGRLDEAMATLGRFHRSARKFRAGQLETEWFASYLAMPSPAIGERIGQLADWGHRWKRLVETAHRTVEQSRQQYSSGQQQESAAWSDWIDQIDRLFRQGKGLVANQLELLHQTLYRCQPCLRDVWHDHLLWTGPRVTGLIDPGSTRIDNVAIDLARLLGSLVEDDTEGWDRGLAAYKQEAGLSLEETGLVTVLDQSGVLLSGAVWVGRLADGQIDASQTERVAQRLKMVIRRMQRLAERTGVA